MQVKKIIVVLLLLLLGSIGEGATKEEYFNTGFSYVEAKRWKEALPYFRTIPYYPDALFFSGVCYYHLGEYQLANVSFTEYLNQSGQLKYFDKAFLYKYNIAECYRLGARRHPFGYKALPKILPGSDEALKLYDEVISALPHLELGALALKGKAELLRKQKKYKESIETFVTLIKRFPKSPTGPIAYLLISDIYLEEAMLDKQNPDLLALAEMNLNHYKRDFPSDEKIAFVERNILEMKEIFAGSLYETGKFYEKKKKPNASLIYYEEAVKRYPETVFAEKCKERSLVLQSHA